MRSRVLDKTFKAFLNISGTAQTLDTKPRIKNLFASDWKDDKLFRMQLDPSIKIKSISHLYEVLPESERITVDVLRQIIIAHAPVTCR